MSLVKSKVCFDQEAHIYTFNGKTLRGITSIISELIFPDKYKDVPEDILAKAIEKGHVVHSTCEMIDEAGITPTIVEGMNYVTIKNQHNLVHEASEYLVSDELYIATCIDKVYKVDEDTYDLGDIKTTYKLDKDYLRWQLSICACLFEKQNPGKKVRNLYGIWLRNDIAELHDIERIPDDIISNLLHAAICGEEFVNPLVTHLPQVITDLTDSITDVLAQMQYWEEKKKELTQTLQKAMEQYDVKSWKTDSFTISRTMDTTREDFDKKKFQAEHPELYNQYIKQTTVKGGIRMKLS
jgi:hypothetical protein